MKDSEGCVVSKTGDRRHKAQKTASCDLIKREIESGVTGFGDANRIVASRLVARSAGFTLKTRGGATGPGLCDELVGALDAALNGASIGKLVGARCNRISGDLLGKRTIRSRLAVAGTCEIQMDATPGIFRNRSRITTAAAILCGHAGAIRRLTPASLRRRRGAGSKKELSQEGVIARLAGSLTRRQREGSKRVLRRFLNVWPGDQFSMQGKHLRNSKAPSRASTIRARGRWLELLFRPRFRQRAGQDVAAKIPGDWPAERGIRWLPGESSYRPAHRSIAPERKCWRAEPANRTGFGTRLDDVRGGAGRGELRLRPRSTGPGVRRTVFETRKFG